MKIQKSGNWIIPNKTLIDLIYGYQPEFTKKVLISLKTLDHHHPDPKPLQDLLKEFCSLEHVPNPEHADRYWRIRMRNPR